MQQAPQALTRTGAHTSSASSQARAWLLVLLACAPASAAADDLPLTLVPKPPQAAEVEVGRLGNVALLNATFPFWKAAPLVRLDADTTTSAIIPAGQASYCASGWDHPDCVSSDAWAEACHVRVADTLWGFLDGAIESTGPDLTLLVSQDGGRTWSLRAVVAKPHYTAHCQSLSVIDTRTLRLVIEQGDCADCGATQGHYTFTSDDLGRTWHLTDSP